MLYGSVNLCPEEGECCMSPVNVTEMNAGSVRHPVPGKPPYARWSYMLERCAARRKVQFAGT